MEMPLLANSKPLCAIKVFTESRQKADLGELEAVVGTTLSVTLANCLGKRDKLYSHSPRLSIVRQCELASISRSSFCREPTGKSKATLRLMLLIDEQFLDTP